MDRKIVLLKTFYNPVEANIVKSRLESAGFPCFLTDEYVSTIQPFYNQAIGGVKLNVFEKDIPEIDKLLDEDGMFKDLETGAAQAVLCPACGSENVALIAVNKSILKQMLSALFPFANGSNYSCGDCGNEFEQKSHP